MTEQDVSLTGATGFASPCSCVRTPETRTNLQCRLCLFISSSSEAHRKKETYSACACLEQFTQKCKPLK